ncbi:glycosyltransferase [Elizabethkingia anophelis]|uniref:glycosyltransferase n=1 Tax=Elizabethkingia anophelis TaxID=1117645 RepID=UPI001591EA9F|nr:glycosyltransferase [Elizabethkingia anophelis]MCT3646236.1 glycosyltransferase [Elizabethkingia anophelis]MCT3647322.1 glycosyltransferase [Elizabethkingia anophelis]MCT3693845.1 glycosyltransferase [Elizabethkingia anophelis]MCT3858626.1 glycosyltransferase [Elizabethkingia anophelis]MCT3911938.1 glycosyltransferase [Elizabethkingia anophelis]
MNNNFLAIIIPLHKYVFFEETLSSIFSQTDMEFNLYIGNDGNKNDENIIRYIENNKGNLFVKYINFDKNIGNLSLTKQWERCIELSNNEEWIWLFSDDDYMDKDCVKKFKETLKIRNNIQIFKYNSCKVHNGIITQKNILKQNIDLELFIYLKLNNKIESYMSDLIFSRKLYLANNRFQNYPLAWCSDDFFIIKSLLYHKMEIIPDTYTYWRYSSINISGIENDSIFNNKKLEACLLFIKDLKKIKIYKILGKRYLYYSKIWFFNQLKYKRKSLSTYKQIYYIIKYHYIHITIYINLYKKK